MSDRIFVDTNILVYAFDKADQYKYDVASNLVLQCYQDKNAVVSTQVLKEFFVTVTLKVSDKMSAEDAEQAVRDFALWTVVETSVSVVLSGINIHRNHSLSFWDAMILAAAKVADCTTLLTEDMGHGTRIEDILILNPFLTDQSPPA